MAETMNFTVENLIEEDKNTIPNALPAKAMRYSMENKNLLKSKGSIYVGTGLTNNVTVSTSSGEDTYETAVTKALEVGTNGQVLVADSTSELGMKWANKAPKASSADDATDANNVTNTINGKNITDIFEADGVTAKNAAKATNVTTQINGKNITDIFESDGVTVKNAKNATKVNELEIKRDSNGVLKIGDTIIPQRKKVLNEAIDISADTSMHPIFNDSKSLAERKFEITISFGTNNVYFKTIKISLPQRGGFGCIDRLDLGRKHSAP